MNLPPVQEMYSYKLLPVTDSKICFTYWTYSDFKKEVTKIGKSIEI